MARGRATGGPADSRFLVRVLYACQLVFHPFGGRWISTKPALEGAFACPSDGCPSDPDCSHDTAWNRMCAASQMGWLKPSSSFIAVLYLALKPNFLQDRRLQKSHWERIGRTEERCKTSTISFHSSMGFSRSCVCKSVKREAELVYKV